ncbi:PepSY domain-containing protein [Oceanibaculum nanhaiense]|uniref:PepSY domain-containing protein n=1 Tax=Oceanibaculum nanhaiense TaxID=1909734 RepID=UPI0025A3D6CB|nr:PepSY domain-containing protein [Oceanibaculum nanhaiense]MDM7947474.1 PepSY domain-containing protein [Oceanibaculum nanhaiense]
MMRIAAPLLALSFVMGSVTLAEARDMQPPADAMPLSQILAKIEQRPDFRYIDDLEWDDDGYYELEYRTKDGGEVRLKLDPKTGEVRR